MPAPIITGLITFITQQTGVVCWDGEVPRYDVQGNPINPSQTVSAPPEWPVYKVYMKEGGFTREYTFEDPYSDEGEILIQIWGTTRQQLEDPATGAMNVIEALLNQATNWPLIPLGGPQSNPYYVISCLLGRWYSGQEEDVRTADGSFLYRADMHYQIGIHGVLSSA